jgi:pyrroloquinoline quinone (PQQ) biosynthesis protein C
MFEEEMHALEAIRGLPWKDRSMYAQYLAQTYYYVTHSTRLLACAAARVDASREKLHHRLLKHAAEERSHHLLAERDLTALGLSVADLPELAMTRALYEPQYYRISYKTPAALFGYILALEGVAVTHGPSVYATARASHGDASTAFLRVHAEDDPDHLKEAFAIIASLNESEYAAVIDNFRWSCVMFRSFLSSIVAADSGARLTAVA